DFYVDAARRAACVAIGQARVVVCGAPQKRRVLTMRVPTALACGRQDQWLGETDIRLALEPRRGRGEVPPAVADPRRRLELGADRAVVAHRERRRARCAGDGIEEDASRALF